MDLNKTFVLWPFQMPYGATGPEPPKPPEDAGAQGNPPDDQGGAKPPDPKDTGKKGDSDTDDDDPYKDFTPKELRRVIADSENAKKAAERERDSYKNKVSEADRKQRTKEENLEADVRERDSTITTLRSANARLAIINGILNEKKWSWHDAEIVAQQLDPNVVKVNDDGRVEGLVKDLARVAKEKPYLLANFQGGQQGPTGIQPGQGGSSSGKSKEDLAKDYPALLTRM